MQLGRRLYELRAARGFTQDRVAAETGFTKGYLSKIENSKVIPSIGTLVKIASALQTDLADLFDTDTAGAEDGAVSIVRSWQRQGIVRGGSSFGYDYIALADKRHHKHMEPFVMIFPPRADNDVRFEKDVRFEHTGEEFMFVLSGKVELSLSIKDRIRTWVLAPGDSAYFDSSIPHCGRSLEGESRALVVIYSAPENAAGRKSQLAWNQEASHGNKETP